MFEMCINTAQGCTAVTNTGSDSDWLFFSLAPDWDPVASEVVLELREVRMLGVPPVSSVTV